MKKRSSNLIIRGGHGNPRTQAENNPYDPNSVPDNAFRGIAMSSPNVHKTSTGKIIRKTASSYVGGAGGSTMGSQARTVSMSPLYYDYRYSSPDKFYFPRDRAQANSIWRDVYRRDATIAIATDMYAELPWSSFDIEGIDDPAIRRIYEDMFTDLDITSVLPSFTRDYLITGELIIHSIFNDSKGYWERCISHDPNYIRVQGLGLAMEQPLMWLRPTPEMKFLANSADPRSRKILNVFPPKIITAIRTNQEIPLEPINTTYIPRRNTSNEVRGTSIYTRLFRINMYEDFVYNASLAVSQRNASPVRLFKLGDPTPGGWQPTEDDVADLAEMLSLAETDPMAAIITQPNLEVDYVGVSDKALLISREWEFIERVKLLALGVAKSFLVGETSFAAAVAGLQTLMERLASLRNLITNRWIINKLCKPVAEMHGFYERSESELENRIRIVPPDERTLVLPKIKWSKSLEPTADPSLLSGPWRDMHDNGILSDRTYMAGAGVDIEVERRNNQEELAYKEQLAEKLGVPVEELDGDSGGGGGGGGLSPGAPPPPPDTEGASLRRQANDEGPNSEKYRLQVEEMSDRLGVDLSHIADNKDKVEIDEVKESFEGLFLRSPEAPGVVQIPPASKTIASGIG